MEFNHRFQKHMEAYPEETEATLRRMADKDALLSLEGITRVLDILRPEPPEVEGQGEFGWDSEGNYTSFVPGDAA